MTTFLRQYPGEKLFVPVTEEEFERAIHPHEVEARLGEKDFGLIDYLECSFRLFDKPGGKLLAARRWPAQSYVRWFARIVRMLHSFVPETLTDFTGVAFTPTLVVPNNASGGVGFQGQPDVSNNVCAQMAIGQGVGPEDSSYFDLIARVGDIQPANKSVVTSQQDAAGVAFFIDQGVTVAQIGGASISEVGLYTSPVPQFQNPFATFTGGQFPNRRTLLAYDQITPVAVPQGGVFAPKYTLSYQV
jgi:hypothetical protein